MSAKISFTNDSNFDQDSKRNRLLETKESTFELIRNLYRIANLVWLLTIGCTLALVYCFSPNYAALITSFCGLFGTVGVLLCWNMDFRVIGAKQHALSKEPITELEAETAQKVAVFYILSMAMMMLLLIVSLAVMVYKFDWLYSALVVLEFSMVILFLSRKILQWSEYDLEEHDTGDSSPISF